MQQEGAFLAVLVSLMHVCLASWSARPSKYYRWLMVLLALGFWCGFGGGAALGPLPYGWGGPCCLGLDEPNAGMSWLPYLKHFCNQG